MPTTRPTNLYQAPKANPLIQAATVAAIVLTPVLIIALIGIFSGH